MIFSLRRAAFIDYTPPIPSSEWSGSESVGETPTRASERSYTVEQKRLAAHRVAAEVRHRRPSMQVRRITPWIEWCAE